MSAQHLPRREAARRLDIVAEPHPATNRILSRWRLDEYPGPSTARTPGRHTRGSLKPSAAGSSKLPSIALGNDRRTGPAAARTSFEPRFKPSPV